MWDDDDQTELDPSAILAVLRSQVPSVRRLRLVGLDGPGAGAAWESAGGTLALGSHPSNDVVLDDRTISRFHCELLPEREGARVRDLGSRNGTVLDGVPVIEAMLRHGSTLQVGPATLRVELGEETRPAALSPREELGSLVGVSVAMRAVFARLEKAAASRDATVLIDGETGTGKEAAAQTIHSLGARASAPFVVVDCAALPEQLVESELFGHEKGAFTGAVSQRIGAFEEAAGGTIFIDEVGELPPSLQPKLLRVLEQRAIRRVGSNQQRPVDVRVIAATHRNLRAAVNDQSFRSDLYYRLAVVQITLPPLRSRPEDLPLLVRRLLDRLGASDHARTRLLDDAFLARLVRAAWPGNVRELRNYLEQCMVLEEAPPLRDASQAPLAIDPSIGYAESRRRAMEDFEVRYVRALQEAHGGNVAQAAEAAGMDRTYLYRLLRKHRR